MIFNGKKTKQVPIVLGGLAAVIFAIVGMLTSTCSYADSSNEGVQIMNIDTDEVIATHDHSTDSYSGTNNSKNSNETKTKKNKTHSSYKFANNITVDILNDDINTENIDLTCNLRLYSNTLYPDTYVLSFNSDTVLPDVALISIDLIGTIPDYEVTDFYIFTMAAKGNFSYYSEASVDENGSISFNVSRLQDYYISTINLEEAQAFVSSLDN